MGGRGAHRALVVLENWKVLQDVVLHSGHISHAHPVLSCGAHKALQAVIQ